MAAFHHVPVEEITRKPVAWLFPEYERVEEAHWQETTRIILATQLGVGRALAMALGSGALPPLPSHEEMLEMAVEEQAKVEGRHRLPAWQIKFERANAPEEG